jgi:hypothetical protein
MDKNSKDKTTDEMLISQETVDLPIISEDVKEKHCCAACQNKCHNKKEDAIIESAKPVNELQG